MSLLTRRDQDLAPWLHTLIVAGIAVGAWLVTQEALLAAAIVGLGSRFTGMAVRRASRLPPPTDHELQRTRVLDAQQVAEEVIHDVHNDLAAVQGKLDLMYRELAAGSPEQQAVHEASRDVVEGLRSVREDIETMVTRIRRARHRLGLMNGRHERMGDA
jgi:signal transduction histidine kinase